VAREVVLTMTLDGSG